MKTYINPTQNQWPEIMARPLSDNRQLVPLVTDILAHVRQNGDQAVRSYSSKFDGYAPNDLQVSDAEFNEALALIDTALKMAIQQAAQNIEKFHADQLHSTIITETMPGVTCWQKALPIQNVGLYIPGGTAPLFSTVLMLAIPANIAQCANVILCTPANKQGKVNPAILFAARMCRVSKVFKIGGAQAIAAMAYGTETIPAVDKIFGPGNQYVTMAKTLVSAEGIAIDMPAGPSELLVVADASTPAAFAASDLLSQAEHGADSQVILVSTDKNKLLEIEQETLKQLEALPRKAIAAEALKNSRLIFMDKLNTAIDFVNTYAPEHLILAVENYDNWAGKVTQAGSVFLGIYTPESAGDYASGTNHTLPTNGFAKAYSGVNLDSFMKKITFQKITKAGLQNIGHTVETMAEAEQLFGHKNAVTLRLNAIKTQN